jgi:hypothetical protein
MANGWLINQKATAAFVVEHARATRHYYADAEGVKGRFLQQNNADVRKLIRDKIESLPSRGGQKFVG